MHVCVRVHVCACVWVSLSGVGSGGQPGASLGSKQQGPGWGELPRRAAPLLRLQQGLARPHRLLALSFGPAAGLQGAGSEPSLPGL